MLHNPASNSAFEAAIASLTQPLNGQYPRPWMTDLIDPRSASVFIVGRNQAKSFDASRLSHQRYMDALFNRNGESCRALYREFTDSRSSPTRKNIDELRRLLLQEGVENVLETNVICYSTPMSSDLALLSHRGGASRGSEIFQTLLDSIRPRVLIVHGSAATEALSKVLKCNLPVASSVPDAPASVRVANLTVFVVNSMAPPAWNKWHSWASQHLQLVAKAVARTDVA